jgi:hypothetical protein
MVAAMHSYIRYLGSDWDEEKYSKCRNFLKVWILASMEIIKKHKKGKHMNTLEKYHIHKLYNHNLHMNDRAIEANNPIFKTLHEITSTNPTDKERQENQTRTQEYGK